MNADQIVQCVDILVACWPWAEWTDKTVDQWCDALAPVDIDHARTVTTKARDTLDRPPSIAWFLAESKNEKERRSLMTHPVDAAPDPDPEGVAAILAACRRLVASSSSQQHNHRGPEPCPVCGGLVGTVGDQREHATP